MRAFLPQGVLVRLAEANTELSDVQEQTHVKGMITKIYFERDKLASMEIT